jgi:ribonucleoside-triphosphate reductase
MFYAELDKLMDISKESLEIKRETLVELRDAGLFPYTEKYLYMGWKNHFSTIGLIGMNEAVANLFGKDLLDPEAVEFAVDVLNHMKAKLLGYQEETGNLYNLEASPAEGTSYRLAKHDKRLFKHIIQAGTEDAPYYTNSTHLPVNATDDIIEALEMQEPLQTTYTGGTVLHGYIGSRIPMGAAKKLIKFAFTNYRLPYMSLTPTFSVCPTHGYLQGEQYECPTCGGVTEVFSRVTGYYRPISRFNIGKKQEYIEREEYIVEEV